MSKGPEKTEISRGMKEGELMFSIKTSDFVFPSADFHYVRAGGWQSLSTASFHKHRHRRVSGKVHTKLPTHYQMFHQVEVRERAFALYFNHFCVV